MPHKLFKVLKDFENFCQKKTYDQLETNALKSNSNLLQALPEFKKAESLLIAAKKDRAMAWLLFHYKAALLEIQELRKRISNA